MEPIGSQMLPQHPLTLRMHQHGEHSHPKPLTKRMRKNNQSQKEPKILMSSIVQHRSIRKGNLRSKPKGTQIEHLQG